MTGTLGLSSAISVAQSGQRVLGAAAVFGRVPSLKLSDGLAPGRFSEVRVVLGAADAKKALGLAIISANAILGALNALVSEAKLAGNEPLVSPFTGLEIGGTRISHLNLNADTNRALAMIDSLVASTEFKNANFISSTGANINVKTSRFGGSIRVAPQPMDSVGLNLSAISLMSADQANDALARINAAINQATTRIGNLESLQRAIGSGNFMAQNLSSIIYATSGNGLPRGSLVDIVG